MDIDIKELGMKFDSMNKDRKERKKIEDFIDIGWGNR